MKQLKKTWMMGAFAAGIVASTAVTSYAFPAISQAAPQDIASLLGALGQSCEPDTDGDAAQNNRGPGALLGMLVSGSVDCGELLDRLPIFIHNCPTVPSLPDETPDQQPTPTPPEQPDVDQGEEDADTPLHAYAAEVVRLVNEARAEAGLEALQVAQGVQAAAQVRAVEQETLFSHTRPDGSSCFTALKDAGVAYRGAGENIAYGQKSPAEVMQGWMNSPGHRANILNPQFTTIGVGFHQGANGVYYWSQMFTY